MLSFDTKKKLSFEVDGAPYMLAYPTIEDFDALTSVEEKTGNDQVRGFLSLLEAKTDKRTYAAICKLTIPELVKLVRAWNGTAPEGEGDSSTD